MHWHSLTVEETLASLATDLEQGLTPSAVRERLAEHGPNTITPQKGPGPIRRALAQFNQALVIILICAGAVTAFLGVGGHLRRGDRQRHHRLPAGGQGRQGH